MHGNMLTLNGQRMSKSTGNTILPQELLNGDSEHLSKGFTPSVVRFFMMQAHYRSVLDISNDALVAAEKGYKRLMEAIERLQDLQPGAKNEEIDLDKWRSNAYAALDDDFNSSILISVLFEAVPWINNAAEGKKSLDERQIQFLKENMKAFVNDILGLERATADAKEEDLLGDVMDVLIELRRGARLEKNWALSDAIRDELGKKGVLLHDGTDGSRWTLEK
jgi:cysteinyl-tRNA synthetase